METVSKKAIDPETGEKYQIDFPAPEVVRQAILELDFPLEGIKIKETAEKFAENFNLSEEQKNAKIKSKGQFLDLFYYDVVAAAFRYLLRKKKLHQPGGKRTPYFLVQEEEQEDIKEEEKQEEVAPTVEDIEDIYEKVHKELAEELLEEIKKKPPAFFEKLVIDLLVAMGYGGSHEDAGKAVGGGGDEGIDGIINEDRLGLDVVYVQAKQWEGSVSRPEIQKFAGALQGQRARKGIFITTSEFTKGCVEYVKSIDSKIILIDGQQLAQFMIEHDVGVSTTKTYEIKRVDSDYFAETE
ncbi:MAG: restriction endonuclease [Candidatus Poribacteria bacterium]|nr:restriction endonuclease [Candidatus Poribacteria bacterium]